MNEGGEVMPLPKRGTPEYEAWRNSSKYGEFVERRRRYMKQLYTSEESRLKTSVSVQKASSTPEARKRLRSAAKKATEQPGFSERQSQLLKTIKF